MLRNTTGVSVAFPATLDALTSAGYNYDHNSSFVKFLQNADGSLPGQDYVNLSPAIGQAQSEDYWKKRSIDTLDLIAAKFFGKIGHLLASHPSDLLPAIELIKTLTDVVPGLITPDKCRPRTWWSCELDSKGSTPDRPNSGQSRCTIVLDKLPGVAAPVAAIGGP